MMDDTAQRRESAHLLDWFEILQPDQPERVDPFGPEVALTVHHWATGGVDEKTGVDTS